MKHAELKPLALFEAFGVEMEYMIVDIDSLKILPIADKLLMELSGSVLEDFDNGSISWSNELVLHVIELKTNGPTRSLSGLSEYFKQNVSLANQHLKKYNAMLLPTGAHPFMNPLMETVIWPHEYNEVYELYNRIFDCKGHGWSNLQSTHINLPFSNDLEFEKLHAAVRLLLPIIPALSASTPIIDSSFQRFKDHRLEYYRKNQSRIPSIAGKIIPERAFDQKAYEKLIFEPIRKEIAPYDSDEILDKHFLNSRGAIARFDRMAVEIRIIDIQESPKMDIAILKLIDAAIKYLISKQDKQLEEQKSWDESILYEMFKETIQTAEDTLISNESYLNLFGLNSVPIQAKDIWKHIAKTTKLDNSEINFILERGTLSTRILEAMDKNYSKSQILLVYKKLAKCLEENIAFDPLLI